MEDFALCWFFWLSWLAVTTFSGVLVRSGSLVLAVFVADGAVLFAFTFCWFFWLPWLAVTTFSGVLITSGSLILALAVVVVILSCGSLQLLIKLK